MTLLEDVMYVAQQLNINAVIIGGVALPAYNVARSTLDLDLCISFPNMPIWHQFLENLAQKGFRTLQKPKLDHDLFTIFGHHSEAEIWLRPCDAFDWDNEMEKRIVIIAPHFHVLAIEDYLLTKLARSDRSSTDLSDIIQILLVNHQKIDWDYFQFRLLKYHHMVTISSIFDNYFLSNSNGYPEMEANFRYMQNKLGI